jgi:phenylacetaldehyde dehydrogenase
MGYQGSFTIDPVASAFLNRDPALYTDGRWHSAASATTLPVFDPASGLEIARIADADTSDVDRAVRSAHTAFKDGRWRFERPAAREQVLMKFAQIIAERGEAFAQLETLEQGKSINLSRMLEVGGSVDWVRYAAGLTTKITGQTLELSLPGGPQHWTAYTRREAIGVVAAISPWNFPMLIALWKVMPALAAGCSVVLKPSEITPLTAMMLAETATEAGLPGGVFNLVTGGGATAGHALITHPLIRKITFTGSTTTGKAIGVAAMNNVVSFSLELGGKNPAIVLADADIEATVGGMMLGGFLNQGQVCAAASRVYVEAPLYDALVQALEGAIKGMSVGAGMDPNAQVNPLVSKAHQAKVERYLADARAQGGDIVTGAATPEGAGYFVSPTLVLNPSDAMKLDREEVFGPVLGITKVADADEAVARANDSDLGLAASLWTTNLNAAMDLTRRIEAGTVWVNTHNLIDPNMPFGGMKQSGIGRDFGTDWLGAYTETKSVCISH